MGGGIKHGRDKALEDLADQLLGKGTGSNKRSIDRDIEKRKYELGLIPLDELKHYDPSNDWDTHDSAFSIGCDDVDDIMPTICVVRDDGNVRARNAELLERDAAMQHVDDADDWGPIAEPLPLLGANEGQRKVCTRCKQSKGLSLFSPKADAKDGLHPWCKECRKDTVSHIRRNSRSEA